MARPARLAAPPLLLLALFLGGGCTTPQPHGAYQREMEQRVLEAINAERQKRDLLPLERTRELDEVAHAHCDYMQRTDRLTHRDGDGNEVEGRLEDRHIPWQLAGENVARNRGFSDPVKEAVRGWMASDGHRRNILGKQYRQTGIGIIHAHRSGYYYFTQVFVRKPVD